MTAKRQREIVIEFEKVKLIRKRAKTLLVNCRGCGRSTDLVPLLEAAELFETAPDNLLRFGKENDCHYQILDEGNIYLCLVSLLAGLKRKNNYRLTA